jgi:HEPN domain-containing protein
MRQETKEWMKKSNEDFDVAKANFKIGKYGAAAFFSQQACEKALKAIQIEKLGRFDKIHDLIKLSLSVGAPKEITEMCGEINPFYIVTRYPDSKEFYDKPSVESALKGCEKVIGWASLVLKSCE